MYPYIGISDFTDYSQVQAMSEVFKNHRKFGSKYRLHAGVMTSYKVLHNLPNRWKEIFPKPASISSIFQSTEVYNCLHYVDYDLAHISVLDDLHNALVLGGTNIDALQLDMIWPNPSDIAEAVHRSRKQVEIVLQIGKDAFQQVSSQPFENLANPMEIVVKLREYEGIVDRVLLDLSMGRGVEMDSSLLIPYIEAIKMHLPDMGIVVAGGLGPNTMHIAESILKMYPDISIDAQGKLRPSGSAMDPLDMKFCERYLVEALKLV